MTRDREFLAWLHERLVHQHSENPNWDYMHKLRCIIKALPIDQVTPNSGQQHTAQELEILAGYAISSDDEKILGT